MKRADLVVFAGPSLSAREVRAIAPCRVLPPARQGDLWRAIALEPRAIALLDGVFEAVPSVWHHEILAAIDAGIVVFGASSMGALRASELWRDGMIGVGRIFGWYKDGVIEDDAEVALLHAGPEHRFEPFTVPLVNVRHNAERAQKAKVLTAREARFLVAAAQCVFFKERTWERVLEETGSQWSQSTREKWRAFAKKGLEDLKAIDARACVRAAAEFARHPSAPAVGQRTHTPSSLVRRRRLRDGASAVNGRLVPNARILAALLDHPDVEAMANAGLRTLLLAGWARELGLSATHAECEAAQRTFWEERAVPAAQRAGLLASAGLDRAEAAVLFETLALEAKLLENAARMVNDGPGIDEALSFEARRLGLWSREARRLAHQRS